MAAAFTAIAVGTAALLALLALLAALAFFASAFNASS